MAKRLVVFTISVIVLVFISGCSSVKPKSVEPDRLEREKVMLIQAQPDELEPNEIAPADFEPNVIEPVKAESDKLQANSATPFHDKCAGIFKEFERKKV